MIGLQGNPSGFDPSRGFRLLGFATGWYVGKCATCSVEYMGDKRSQTCLTCAAVEADLVILQLRKQVAALEAVSGKAIEYQLVDLLDPARITEEQAQAIWEVLKCIAASAIEARRAATGTGAVHESAVAEGQTPNPSSHPENTHG